MKRSNTRIMTREAMLCRDALRRNVGFSQAALLVVMQIPSGQTMSYGEVAKRAGFSGAARAVGTLMRKNMDPTVPCHRVIRSDGRPGEYNRGGEMTKRRILEGEGVVFDSYGRVV